MLSTAGVYGREEERFRVRKRQERLGMGRREGDTVGETNVYVIKEIYRM